MQQEISKPMDIFGHQVTVSGSTGIAFGTAQHTSADQLLRDADFAMYRAKSDGGGRHVIFDSAMELHANSHVQKEFDYGGPSMSASSKSGISRSITLRAASSKALKRCCAGDGRTARCILCWTYCRLLNRPA